MGTLNITYKIQVNGEGFGSHIYRTYCKPYKMSLTKTNNYVHVYWDLKMNIITDIGR